MTPRDHSTPYDQCCGLGIAYQPILQEQRNMPQQPRGTYICGSDLPDTVMSSGFFADDTEVIIFDTLPELYRYAPSCLPSIENSWLKASQINLATAVRSNQ